MVNVTRLIYFKSKKKWINLNYPRFSNYPETQLLG